MCGRDLIKGGKESGQTNSDFELSKVQTVSQSPHVTRAKAG